MPRLLSCHWPVLKILMYRDGVVLNPEDKFEMMVFQNATADGLLWLAAFGVLLAKVRCMLRRSVGKKTL
ncbi:hypothetical protein BJX62DRAFT_243234 [Aspergillus germanicus]